MGSCIRVFAAAPGRVSLASARRWSFIRGGIDSINWEWRRERGPLSSEKPRPPIEGCLNACVLFTLPLTRRPSQLLGEPIRDVKAVLIGGGTPTQLCPRTEPTRRQVPFGAAHRVNFDTPPLIGCCRGTCVPRGEPVGWSADRRNRVA